MIVAPRVAELAAEAVDPDRSDLLRGMSAEEVRHRLRRDNPTATEAQIGDAAAVAYVQAREARP